MRWEGFEGQTGEEVETAHVESSFEMLLPKKAEKLGQLEVRLGQERGLHLFCLAYVCFIFKEGVSV